MAPSTFAAALQSDKKVSSISKKSKSANKVSFVSEPCTSTSAFPAEIDADLPEAEAEEVEDDTMEIDPSSLLVPISSTAEPMETSEHPLAFPALSSHAGKQTTQERRIPIPPHRLTPLKKDWVKIYTPLVEECGLQIRMNTKKRSVELKVCLSLRLTH